MISNRIVWALAATSALALSACKHENNGFQNGQSSNPATSSAPINASTDGGSAAGTAFLAQNKNAPGVKTTASGLQYKVNKEGAGKNPTANDVVTVEYEGRLIDGSVFDSTAQHGGQPATFPLNGVIPGWTEGLQLMKEGGDYTFYIPANLAYGDNSPAPSIPPGSTLVFDVKLIKVGQ